MPAPCFQPVLDHVAIAVPKFEPIQRTWVEGMGGRLSMVYPRDDRPFRARQYSFSNGAKLELIAPHPNYNGSTSFIREFLQRRGVGIHHVTLKVHDLAASLQHFDDARLPLRDVDTATATWQEGFLSPTVVGGIVVQIASTTLTDHDWASATGLVQQTCPPDAASLDEVVLGHEKPRRAATLWSALGATVSEDGPSVVCTWPDAPMQIRIEPGEAGPKSIRLSGGPDQPPSAGLLEPFVRVTP